MKPLRGFVREATEREGGPTARNGEAIRAGLVLRWRLRFPAQRQVDRMG
jgi:hypothetical protein